MNLLDKAKRIKENALPGNLVWADLDTCSPKEVEPYPSVVIESSPGRWQALWKLDENVPPEQAEEYSRKIAYKYNQNGSDVSGWDITQLLRVPFTKNWKYESRPEVKVIEVSEEPLALEVFEAIEAPPDTGEYQPMEGMPDLDKLPEPEKIIYKYQLPLQKTAFKGLYGVEPNKEDDWSKLLWRLINICIEAGMTSEEVFVIAQSAGCNKYRRDNRPYSYLWRDVQKAESAQAKLTLMSAHFTPLLMPELTGLTDTTGTFVDDYREWAEKATDAVPAYHDLSAFILLSTFISGGLVCKTNYGPMIPNLWGLVLGDSTLTRKTTAMRMVVDLIQEIDQELILATDGSVEGLLTGLSSRPSRVSMFYKDEVSGFIDSINRKDYLAGMSETLTQLYDVPPVFTRRLRKETISVTSPIFIFFGGGIRDKVYSLLSEEYILSGFLPRFLIISGDADISKIRRTGPLSHDDEQSRKGLRGRLADLYENYNQTGFIKIGNTAESVEVQQQIQAILTPDAWKRYGDMEMELVQKASESPVRMLALPTFERLSRSTLKMSCLLAASRQVPEDQKIEVTEQDVNNAAWYTQEWGRYTVDLLSNAGKGATQRVFDRVLSTIQENPNCTRSFIMQRHKLGKREMDEIQGTLEDRGQIQTKKEGRGYRLWAV